MSDCLFCKIADGQIPAKIAYENDKVIAFYDITPQAPVHLLVIPKKHIPAAKDLTPEDMREVLPPIFEAIQSLSVDLGFKDQGYRIVNNCGIDGGQTVNHLHFHVLGGRQLQWPPG